MKDWTGKRVLILGAARQGVALARWLVVHGAIVTVSDMRPADQLTGARESLHDLSIDWALGGHPLELLKKTEILCLSGGVPPELPIVREAARLGIPLSNDTDIFMDVVPCQTVGITGSAGKTTTTALVGEMAERAMKDARERRGTNRDGSPPRHPAAYVGGNIGDPLIKYVDEMEASDLAVLEISSFQLEQATRSPNVAAILNITPNHLDRHVTMNSYTAAKARILDFQTANDRAVLGRDDPGAWNLRAEVRGELHSFGLSKIEPVSDGTYMEDGMLYLSDRGVDIALLRRDQIRLPGGHNVLNVLAAFAIGHAAGLPLDAMLLGAEGFQGMPHRLELVRELRGVRWYDDSIATAPERSMAAIHSFDAPIVLLLGGRDKNLPWEDLVRLIFQRVDHLILFGEVAEKVERVIIATRPSNTSGPDGTQSQPGALGGGPQSIHRTAHLREAVLKASEIAERGDVVLLSPGGTSFDEFTDFEERGATFRAWVQDLS
jgi:UDP-N-acetylmuramoylalanine--D-glutamate ligase